MARMLEYLNSQSHTIQLSSPERKIIKVPANTKIILSDWYLSYCPKYLRVVREVSGDLASKIAPKPIESILKYRKQENKPQARKAKPAQKRKTDRRKIRQGKAGARPKPANSRPIRPPAKGAKAQTPARIAEARSPTVGRQMRQSGRKLFNEAIQKNGWTISNNIGVGILSFNRLKSLQRLIGSIRKYSDLRRLTVFVSDESTDASVKAWLKKQTDLVVLTDQSRLGIAGNSNRLIRCLSRFEHCFLLNDDVEIARSDWADFYIGASKATGIKHFCFHQPGVYGAKRNGTITNKGGYKIETIKEKPHGALMYYTNAVFQKVGFFDERFGMYGAEHVDWSERVSFSGIQQQGYHDLLNSENYFKIHQEKSVVPERARELQKGRTLWKEIRSRERVYVNPTHKSNIPSITVIVPLRNIGRQAATEVIINSVRSQLFPNVEIILVEQDETRKFNTQKVMPIQYMHAKNKHKGQPFTKALAFNLGVSKAKYNKVVLQDADIMCSSGYLRKVHTLLDSFEGVHIGSKVLYLSQKSSNDVVKTGILTDKNDCERAVGYFEGGSLACTKRAYFKVGGFNEQFEGYGVEDCDFFDRLKNFTKKFNNVRTEDFVHLWHGRTDGWERYHHKNKKIAEKIKKKNTPTAYVESLVARLRVSYPVAVKELSI
tara:strand:- start:62386 stop:64362 length:1977 start_codon:yes stop_codon:yes gene_type:complete